MNLVSVTGQYLQLNRAAFGQNLVLFILLWIGEFNQTSRKSKCRLPVATTNDDKLSFDRLTDSLAGLLKQTGL